MSTFRVPLRFAVPAAIGNPQTDQWEEVEALVDTGSTFTTLPRTLLERLGIDPGRREPFELADGSVVESEVGEARVRVEGKEVTTPVIFGEPAESVLLGAVTLEACLLAVDPVHERLVPVQGLRVIRLRAT